MNRRDELKFLASRKWRMEHLYKIVDRYGKEVPFKLNWCQEDILKNLHFLNVILKARQLGSSTLSALILLDLSLFSNNETCVIVADSKETSEKLFKKIQFAYEHLPEDLKDLRKAEQSSVREMTFSNGSSIGVSTTTRGSSLTGLVVSEFGRMSRHYPTKAAEVVSGSLNSLAPGNFVIIESTAEGSSGHFHDIVKQAEKNKDKQLSPLDFKLHFYPWFREEAYQLEQNVLIPKEYGMYFDELAEKGIQLSREQKNWYVKKAMVLGDAMLSEFPSLVSESFYTSNEGSYYGKVLNSIRAKGQIGSYSWDPNLPVHTSWDLGISDMTSIWYVQLFQNEIRIIDYDEFSGESLQSILSQVQRKPYTFGKFIGPHDLKVREFSTGQTRIERARQLGVTFDVAENISIQDGIDSARSMLYRCWFDQKNCSKGLEHLEAYSKDWDQTRGCWRSAPKHDAHSHAADSFRYLAVSIKKLGGRGTTAEDIEKHFQQAQVATSAVHVNPLETQDFMNYY